MPAYKDTKTNKWFCKFYYEDYTGNKKQKKKRGFTTKREALDFERDFLVKYQKDVTITFKVLVDHYIEDIDKRLKQSTVRNKQNIIGTHLLPYFKDKQINRITPSDIRKWQNDLLEKSYEQTYLRGINALLSIIFNYAVNYYDLKENPCKKAGSLGNVKPEKDMIFWTRDQFNTFIGHVDNIDIRTAFYVLFYTGIRIGELLALTWDDIDLDNETLTINKTLQRIHRENVITPPKTVKSNRTITLFPFLIDKLQEYKKTLYEPKNSDRVFQFSAYKLSSTLKREARKESLPILRVHDLRHSHASLLIELGLSPLAIADRLGHENIQTTLNTYSHLYPSKQDEIRDLLQNITIS